MRVPALRSQDSARRDICRRLIASGLVFRAAKIHKLIQQAEPGRLDSEPNKAGVAIAADTRINRPL